MSIFDPVWMKQNEKKALRYVEKCKDQRMLRIIALTGKFETVRLAAFNKITNRSELRYIAISPDNDSDRFSTNLALAALEKAGPYGGAYIVSLECKSQEVFEAAVKITGHLYDYMNDDYMDDIAKFNHIKLDKERIRTFLRIYLEKKNRQLLQTCCPLN